MKKKLSVLTVLAIIVGSLLAYWYLTPEKFKIGSYDIIVGAKIGPIGKTFDFVEHVGKYNSLDELGTNKSVDLAFIKKLVSFKLISASVTKYKEGEEIKVMWEIHMENIRKKQELVIMTNMPMNNPIYLSKDTQQPQEITLGSTKMLLFKTSRTTSMLIPSKYLNDALGGKSGETIHVWVELEKSSKDEALAVARTLLGE